MERSNFDLVSEFQQAVGNPIAWLAAFENLTHVFAADHGHVVGRLGAGKTVPLFQTVGLDDADADRFRSDRARELWGPIEPAIPQGRPTLQSEVISERNFERTAFYNEIVRPVGGFDCCVYREHRGAVPFQFALCRSDRTHGTFEEPDRERLGHFTTYIASTYDLHQRLISTEQHNARLSHAMDLLDESVLVLDRKAKLQFANKRAMQLLGQPDIWLATVRVEDLKTRKQIKKLTEVAAESLSQNLSIERQCITVGHDGDMLLIDMVSFAPAGFAHGIADGSGLILFVRSIAAQFSFDRQALSYIHGLSARESEIAEYVSRGSSVAAIALETGLTEGTVRFYLKQIFGKLGVNSQTALAAFLQIYRRRS